MKSVLCIDDDPVVLAMLDKLLVHEGYLVGTAKCGYDALRLIDGGCRYDAILLDLAMPNMDGNEFMRQMAARDNCTPVIVLSAYVEKLDRQPEALVAKPPNCMELLELVKKLTSRELAAT